MAERRTVLQQQICSPAALAFMLTGEWPADVGFERFTYDEELGSPWQAVRESVLASFVWTYPGRRPWAWWRHEAPPWTTEVPSRVRPLAFDYADVWNLKQPRQRVGGVGTPSYECLNIVPSFRFGLPTQFVSEFDVLYYNGRARDVHGNPIGTTYHEGHFPYRARDTADPPTFESQASYLRRYGFLSAAEQRRLPADAFEPEMVTE